MSRISGTESVLMVSKREARAERDAIERRQQALKALLTSRKRRLGETLDQRIKRAGREGGDGSLTRAEWQQLHRQELIWLRVQIADLRTEQMQLQQGLSRLKRAVRRSDRLRAQYRIAGKRNAARRAPVAGDAV